MSTPVTHAAYPKDALATFAQLLVEDLVGRATRALGHPTSAEVPIPLPALRNQYLPRCSLELMMLRG